VGPQGNTKWDFGQWSRDLKSKFKVSLLDQNLGEKKQYFWIALIFFCTSIQITYINGFRAV
jgi:hypothetical protein